MFSPKTNDRALDRIKVEQRIKTVEAEIESIAGQVSKRPRSLARRLKDIALNRPAVLISAIDAEHSRAAVSHVNAELDHHERIHLAEDAGDAVRTLLASAVEYSWANAAKESF